MEPNDLRWVNGCRSPPVNYARNHGNVAASWQYRQLGLKAPQSEANRSVFEHVAEDRLVHKIPLNVKCCDLPGYPRSTFLMVFSPDGTTVASTHGNHYVYLTELANGKHVQILKGHPRTPWCIAFHPSHPHLIGSGCLGGQVRVWDYASGGSEVWTVAKESVIASIAFHPTDQLLVVATHNELYFWDWSQPAPFAKVNTNNINEKVRYVAFDALGHKLITGIAVWSSGCCGSSLLQPTSQGANSNNDRPPADSPNEPPPPRPNENSAQELFVNSYHNLVQRYDNLVRNYHRLFLSRSQPPNVTDRGTDPMEVESRAEPSLESLAARVRRTNHSFDNLTAELSGANPGAFRESAGNQSSNTENNNQTESTQRQGSSPGSAGQSAPPTANFGIIEHPHRSLETPRPTSQSLLGLMATRRSAFEPLTGRARSPSSDQPPRAPVILPNPFSSPSLSQTDRDRLRRSSVSRTRAFSRDLNDTDELTSAFSETTIQMGREWRSPRTMGFSTLMDPDVSSRTRGFDRTLHSRPLRYSNAIDPLANEDSRRRALDRLLALERLRPNEAAPVPHTPQPRLRLREERREEPREAPSERFPMPIRMEIPIPSPLNGPSPLHSVSDLLAFETLEANSLSASEGLLRGLLPTTPDARAPSPPRAFSQYLNTTLQSDVDSLRNLQFITSQTREPSAPTASTSTAPPDSVEASESPTDPNQASLSISQSLDIIRDILRDSGNRLLNLITDMSYSTLASVDGRPQDVNPAQNPSGELYTATSPRIEGEARRRVNLLSSSSDTDSDRSLEVNIYRTRNATFPENRRSDVPDNRNAQNERVQQPTDRMVVDLDVRGAEGASDSRGSVLHTLHNNRINITVSNNRFRFRTGNLDDSNSHAAESAQSRECQSSTATMPASRDPINANNSIDFSSNTSTAESSAAPTITTGFSNAAGPSTLQDSSLLDDSSRLDASTSSTEASNPVTDETSDWQMPSTSRDTDWLMRGMLPLGDPPVQNPLSAAEALRKVKLGIEALQRHTTTLTDMWLRGTRTSMRELRIMWEDLRRHVVALNRQTGRNENASYFARSFLERCQMIGRSLGRNAESFSGRDMPRRSAGAGTTESAVRADASAATDAPESSQSEDPTQSGSNNPSEGQPSTSRSTTEGTSRTRASSNLTWSRNKRLSPSATRSAFKARSTPPTRRRMSSNNRLRSGEDLRMRQRMVQRIEQCLNNARGSIRARHRENARSLELHFTRHEIRVRAMQVLSIMFNVMMSCLEEGELSSQIIVMLRTLKKALGVTCLLLMTNNRRREPVNPQNLRRRNSTTPNTDQTQENQSTAESTASVDVSPATTATQATSGQSQQPISDTNSVSTNINVPSASTSTNDSSDQPQTTPAVSVSIDRNKIVNLYIHAIQSDNAAGSSSQPPPADRDQKTANSAQTITTNDAQQPLTFQRWSNRLAVQISAANLNRTDTARRRREIYLERKRLKALHKWNPSAHPLTKAKVMPLVSHRIPTVRMPPARKRPRTIDPNATSNTSSREPAAPTEPQPSTSGSNSTGNASRIRQEFRENLFRFAQLHAARLRNATRNRYRIRLYTPSSVREMFDILTTSPNERESESPPVLNNASDQNPQPYLQPRFATYRPRLLTVHNDLENAPLPTLAEGRRPLSSLLNDVSVPSVQVNNLPVNEAPEPPTARRINEYLQPIILAQQNALVVDEAMGSGLLDAGLISESLVVPVHRVQAWDFTRGEAPDIKDSSKNVVVQRCKIHNDASIDISRDGRLLVALLPVHRIRNMSHRLGVYSLEWERLGECLHSIVLEQSAVSVALSPTARHLAVGLGSRRVTTLPHNRNNTFAMLFRLSDEEGPVKVRILDHNWEHGFTSLNCLRWAPASGQGLLYANNTGQLIIMS